MVLLFYFLLRWKKNVVKRIGDVKLVNQLIMGSSPAVVITRFIVIVTAFALCAFAAANLRKQTASGQVSRKGIDVVIALDVSKSMLAEDIQPNRLERAKQIVAKIIDKLGDDRIGLVIFAGRAYLQMPITTDHSAARLYLSGISPDDVPTQGTVVSQALKTSYAAFNTKEKKYRAVILITDGEDHDDEALAVTKQMASEGIMINTVGIGSSGGATIPDQETGREKLDENGKPVISRLNEKELSEIAKTGNGIYQLFTSSEEVATRLQLRLANIGETTIVDSSTADYEYYFFYFLAGALLILVLESLIVGAARRKKKLVPTVALSFFILISVSVNSQTVKDDIISGNKAYKENAFPDAVKSYQNALGKSSSNETATYNLGNAFYKNDNAEEAIRSYESVIAKSKDSEIVAKAYYNKGVAHQKLKQNAEAIDAYKKALKMKPSDEEARQNLQRLLQEMKQQQQQQQDKKDDKDKKKDQKKENKKQEEKKDQKEEQPKPRPSKLKKEDAEEKLKALLQHEKDLQDKLRRVKVAGPDKPKKDW